jgi:hypothetical protein
MRSSVAALLLLVLTAGAGKAQGFRLEVDALPVQESPDTAFVTARWFYTYPAHWTVRYLYRVDGIASDSTALDSATVAVPKLAGSQQLEFCVAMDRVSPEPVQGPEHCEPFVVPGRPLYTLLTSSSNVTGVDSIPHDPRFEVPEGTLWLEFTPNSLIGVQGIWSKDYNGYEAGGHLSIGLRGDSLRVRLQSDSVSYEYQAPGVVNGELNQVAVEFGPGGFKGWLNTTQVFTDPYTGGLVGNLNAIVIGANSQGTAPWEQPLDGTVDQAELYDGLYDFSGRWGEPPVVPEPPVPEPDSVQIRVSGRRIWHGVGYEGDTVTVVQYFLAPATYREIDYRIGLTESYHYEVWINGAKVGYTADASWGVSRCDLAENGETCPVEPFQVGRHTWDCDDHALDWGLFVECNWYGPDRYWGASVTGSGVLTTEVRLYRRAHADSAKVLVDLRRDNWTIT